jgi:hypothetical protein
MSAAPDRGKARHGADTHGADTHGADTHGQDGAGESEDEEDGRRRTLADVDAVITENKRHAAAKKGLVHTRVGVDIRVVIFSAVVLSLLGNVGFANELGGLFGIPALILWIVVCGCCGCNDQRPGQCDCICYDPPEKEPAAPPQVVVQGGHNHFHQAPAAQNALVHERGAPAAARYQAFASCA